jgi:UDP-GlcNAc:undecaprenyl-phosphate GlcNAc-1-phosphate transferase
MYSIITAMVTSFALAGGGTILVRPLARRLGAIDRPDNFRKIHQHEIPRLGGIAIFVAFVIPLLRLALSPRQNPLMLAFRDNPHQLMGLFCGALLVLAMGIMDDMAEMHARHKLLLQAIAAVLAYFSGYAMRTVAIPFHSPLQLGLFGLPATLVWFLICMNAINLIDGLDGLAAGIALLVSGTLILVSLHLEQLSIMIMFACLSGAILGFLLHNFHPASIFLGDSGSHLLGFLLAALAIQGTRRPDGEAVAILIPVLAMGIPILDTTMAILRRWSLRLPIFAPDRYHLHHVLLSYGLGHRPTVLILYLVNAVFCAIAMFSALQDQPEFFLVSLTLLAVLAIVVVHMLGMFHIRDLTRRISGDWSRNQQSSSAKVEVLKAMHRMQTARSLPEVWQLSESVFQSLNLDFAVVTLAPSISKFTMPRVLLSWNSTDSAIISRHQHGFWHAHIHLQQNGQKFGTLEVGTLWHKNPQIVLEILELLQKFQLHLARHLIRFNLHQTRATPHRETSSPPLPFPLPNALHHSNRARILHQQLLVRKLKKMTGARHHPPPQHRPADQNHACHLHPGFHRTAIALAMFSYHSKRPNAHKLHLPHASAAPRRLLK